MDRPHPAPDDGIVFFPQAPEGELTEAKQKDHPVWGVILTAIVCATLLIAIQMVTDYHW